MALAGISPGKMETSVHIKTVLWKLRQLSLTETRTVKQQVFFNKGMTTRQHVPVDCSLAAKEPCQRQRPGQSSPPTVCRLYLTIPEKTKPQTRRPEPCWPQAQEGWGGWEGQQEGSCHAGGLLYVDSALVVIQLSYSRSVRRHHGGNRRSLDHLCVVSHNCIQSALLQSTKFSTECGCWSSSCKLGLTAVSLVWCSHSPSGGRKLHQVTRGSYPKCFIVLWFSSYHRQKSQVWFSSYQEI